MRPDIYQFEDLDITILELATGCPELSAACPLWSPFENLNNASEQDHAAWLLQRAAVTLNGG